MWLRSAAFVKVSHCRVPSKSLSLFSPPSLSSRSRWEALLASLCRADRSGAAALTRSFGRGRCRWVTRSGDGRRTALFFCDAGRAAA